MTEAELHKQITRLCTARGLWWFHAYDMRRGVQGEGEWARTASGAGFVDVIIVGNRGALFVEEKSADGRRSKAQMRWADRIVRAGLAYRMWRPCDLADGTIAAELDTIR